MEGRSGEYQESAMARVTNYVYKETDTGTENTYYYMLSMSSPEGKQYKLLNTFEEKVAFMLDNYEVKDVVNPSRNVIARYDRQGNSLPI
jgi:hypothetical protein